MGSILKHIRNFVMSIVFGAISPFILIVFLPFICWRVCVKCLAKILQRGRLVKMVPIQGSVLFALDNNMYEETHGSILITGVVEGQVDIEKVKRLAVKNATSKPEYFEMTYKLTTWLGYYFWEKNKNFDIKNHVSRYKCNKEILTIQDYMEIEQKLLQRGWKRNQSPWEVIVIDDFKQLEFGPKPTTNRGLLIFKMAHGMSDGYSILKLMEMTNTTPKEFKKVKINFRQPTLLQKIVFVITLPFRTLYDVSNVLNSKWSAARKSRQWRPEYHKLSHRTNIFRTTSYPVSKVKKIKDSFKVSFQAALYSAYSQAVKYAIDKNFQEKTPDYGWIASIFAKPGHPLNRLKNYLRYANLKLHIPAMDEDAHERLLQTNNEMVRVGNSALVVSSVYLVKPLGTLFPSLIRYIFSKMNPPSITSLSSFPGPIEPVTLLDLDLSRVVLSQGSLSGPLSFHCMAFTYCEMLEITLCVDENMPNCQEFGDDLMSAFENELNHLYKNADSKDIIV